MFAVVDTIRRILREDPDCPPKTMRTFEEEWPYLLAKYTQAIMPNTLSNSPKEVHYHMMIDGSGSERNYKFKTACLSKQVRVLDFKNEDENAPTKVSIFKFNQKTTRVLPLCSKRKQIIDTLNALSYEGGNTNPADAFGMVYNYIKETNSSQRAQDIIICATDGDLRGAEKILRRILNDASLLIKVVFVFVNTTVPNNFYSQYQVEERQVIHFKDFQMMEKIFEELLNSQTPPVPKIDEVIPSSKSAKVYLLSNVPLKPIAYFTLQVYDQNNNNALYVTEKAEFEDSIIEGLKPETVYKLRARSHYSDVLASEWSDFTSFTTFSIKPIVEWMKDPNVLEKKHAELLKKILTCKPSDRQKMMGSSKLNIAVFGMMQHGKSATICTICSTFAGNYQTPCVSMYNPDQTVTTNTSYIKALSSQDNNNSYLNLIDTFGIKFSNKNDPNNYSTQPLFSDSNYATCLGELLSGRLPPGYKEWDEVDESKLLRNTNIDNKIHAITFIVDIVAIAQDSQMQVVKEFLRQIISEYKRKPLIIFTKCDKIMQGDLPENTKARMRDVYDNKKLKEAINHFLTKVPIVDKTDLMLFANYTERYDPEEGREYDKELLLLDIIDNLRQRGEAFIDDYFRNYVQVFLDDGKYLGTFEVPKQTDLVSHYDWKLAQLLKQHGYNASLEFSINYFDKYSSQQRLLKRDDFGRTQVSEVLSEGSDYPKITITLPSPSGHIIKKAPKPQVSSSPKPVISSLLLKLEGEDKVLGFVENVNETMKLAELRAHIQDAYSITDFVFSGHPDESQVMISEIAKKTGESTYSCTLRKENSPQKIKIIDEVTDTPIIDIEVPNLEVRGEEIQKTLKDQIGNFSFIKILEGFKVPAPKDFEKNKVLKDLLEGKDQAAPRLLIRRN